MTIITSPEGIRLARLAALKGALKLELKGIKRSRGRTAYSILKKDFGYRGSRKKVLEQVEKDVRTTLWGSDVILTQEVH